jgi:site-specific DNA-methyltransferase (adenine-specific)
LNIVYETENVALVNMDCMEAMRLLPAASVDAVVTDPPYELGFMGKGWDRSGIAFDPDTWRACLRVLKPGGHLLAFGATRTYHRIAVAIEDAGFDVRDTLAWLYGSGFPKSLNLHGDREGWGTALKPAFEPVIVARKPLVGTVAANVSAHGTGALNIDGCRIGTTKDVPASVSRTDGAVYGKYARETGDESGHNPNIGRWPANVLLDEEAAAALDAQTGVLAAGNRPKVRSGIGFTGGSVGGEYDGARMDSGGASRFFYVAKAAQHERPKVGGKGHATVKPVALMRWLVRLITPPYGIVLDPFAGTGTTAEAAIIEGHRCVLIEAEADHLPLIQARLAKPIAPTLFGAS